MLSCHLEDSAHHDLNADVNRRKMFAKVSGLLVKPLTSNEQEKPSNEFSSAPSETPKISTDQEVVSGLQGMSMDAARLLDHRSEDDLKASTDNVCVWEKCLKVSKSLCVLRVFQAELEPLRKRVAELLHPTMLLSQVVSSTVVGHFYFFDLF